MTILVATLGYFIDLFDLILFVLVRVQSLTDLQVPHDQMLRTGALLLNMQMAGLILGGLFWGVLGDRRGRLSVLLGSILVYSFANLANAFVTSIEAYAVLRFVAGVGLAGEMGAGVTIVSELMPQKLRGYGSTIIVVVGVFGAVAAAWVADVMTWRHAYIFGGVIGLCLLVLRLGVRESAMFHKVRDLGVSRGRLVEFLRRPRLLGRVFVISLIGIPIWFVIGILVTFTPEFAPALGLGGTPPKVTTAIIYLYAGLAVGGAAVGLLSQWLQSRRRAVLATLVVACGFLALYPRLAGASPGAYYWSCFGFGCTVGHWAMFCLLYTSPSPRDGLLSRMPSSA